MLLWNLFACQVLSVSMNGFSVLPSSIIGKMKRMANPINVSNKRTCFNDETKLDSSFSDHAVPLHHFHLGQDIYAAVTYWVF
ncbi:hypothetical protein NPIL_573661 [Nephila pilipes]|uniref:Uncharacterized protein n=1 Tax=Nephila pilipes TaxID=299642 RepID=A0A8X6TSQ1_NEPPI|nr:hypothetical protein NPIL_573661 [Nephila pilipes]